jgi:hypothetical protein
MPTILQFPKIDKQRLCGECGAPFLPRETHHRFCLPCFKADRAVRALQTANRLWNELVGCGRR